MASFGPWHLLSFYHAVSPPGLAGPFRMADEDENHKDMGSQNSEHGRLPRDGLQSTMQQQQQQQQQQKPEFPSYFASTRMATMLKPRRPPKSVLPTHLLAFDLHAAGDG
ncbi:hypothetical protein ACHAQJ_009461 [Trichoderma viride]